MKLWRVANRRFNTLDGVGGLYVGGRWHTAGKPIVYTAEHPALAALEILVHMDMALEDLPEFVLLEIEVPDEIKHAKIECELSDRAVTTREGDEWLTSKSTAICQVPSVILPAAFNYLINPAHPDADKIKIVGEQPFSFDERLFS